MTQTLKTPVVFLWHMHQPDYRDCISGEYLFPWTYLHALKDYVDMVAHLENYPGCKAVFNFVPILIEQLNDYKVQLADYFEHKRALTDPLLALLTQAPKPAIHSESFSNLLYKCTRANRPRIIERFKPYQTLVDLYDLWKSSGTDSIYFNEQFLTDMAVWYHLGWLGETLRRKDKRVQSLQDKAHTYSTEDCHLLLSIITEELSGLAQRYRTLAESGQIEISTTPYAHPIMPLLLDINSTLEAMPNASLPEHRHYADGATRCQWHIDYGLEVFAKTFGFKPVGCWASEGALSEATLKLLDNAGFQWTATGDSVLFNSLKAPKNAEIHQRMELNPHARHNSYQLEGKGIKVFFRDDGLSDKIGFEYADWHADDAVGDFVHHLEIIAKKNPAAVISIVMDGENAWEYYPENAWYFLDALYKKLESHPLLKTTTYKDLLASEHKSESYQLKQLTAGSWVYGTFSTWIGDKDKNHAWNLLCQAKLDCDKALATQTLSDQQRQVIDRQLAMAEGSDWFWWFGDYNPSDSVRDFDHLFRTHLQNLYRLLSLPVPDLLLQPISHGSGAPARGGVMRHGHKEDEQ